MNKKSNIITIIKKEFARFFGDKRLFITTIFLPGIMIYAMYSFMGDGLMNQFTADEEYIPIVNVVALPESIEGLLAEAKVELVTIDESDIDAAKEAIVNKEKDILMVFPEDFDLAVSQYESLTASVPAPMITIYYNSTDNESYSAYQMLEYLLGSYENLLANKFDINMGGDSYDLATKEDATGQIFAMMLPMLMMMFLFSGCMAVAPEAIAGEKERGTIATMLVTPMKRSELAIGKIISLSAIALMSGMSSFVGTMLSLPKLMGASGGEMSASVYKTMDYVWLLLVIFATVLVIISMISILSAFAKTIKEASTAVLPLMLVVMVVGVMSMMGDAKTELYWYVIPLFNSSQCMSSIFSFTATTPMILITIISNLVYTVAGVIVLEKMFQSEKIMFSR